MNFSGKKIGGTIASMQEPETLIAKYKADLVAVAFHDLDTGAEFFINADQPFHPASTFKVAVMMEVYNQVQKSRFGLEDEITIYNSFHSIADGSLFSTQSEDDAEQTLYQKLGSRASIRELTRLMIVRSSNLATNILIEKVGISKVDGLLRELKVDGVSVIRGVFDRPAYQRDMNNSASARGLMQIMKLLAEGRVVSREASREMVENCLAQEFNEGIPARLPTEVRVAHKTGWDDGIYHDFGIVYPRDRGPYILAIMTRGLEKDEGAADCVAEISNIVYKRGL